MTTDFDDILNLTKKDFESKPITTIYFIKDELFKSKYYYWSRKFRLYLFDFTCKISIRKYHITI